MASRTSRTRVFQDIMIGTEPAGRLIFELYTEHAPKTCENFRVLCTGEKPPLTYKGSPFHRIIDEFMLQGGDITLGNGRGGDSIYGGEFADENIGWRDIDGAGLLCMANRGKNTNSSQFFITLDACPHLNSKHTVFGHVVSGHETLARMSKVKTDSDDTPLDDVVIAHCGELEKKPRAKHLQDDGAALSNSVDRGRRKRQYEDSRSRSRSSSPSRGHGRRSGSRHRHRHRRHKRDVSVSASRSPTPPVRDRRRSDASHDHAFRGRQRRRSRSGSRSPAHEGDRSPKWRRHGRRSPPPSRPRSESPDHRRQRSLPNQYRREDRRLGNSYGRLGAGASARGDGAGIDNGNVVYKGRGAMKFKEGRKRW